jgi:hypothetical protein
MSKQALADGINRAAPVTASAWPLSPVGGPAIMAMRHLSYSLAGSCRRIRRSLARRLRGRGAHRDEEWRIPLDVLDEAGVQDGTSARIRRYPDGGRGTGQLDRPAAWRWAHGHLRSGLRPDR